MFRRYELTPSSGQKNEQLWELYWKERIITDYGRENGGHCARNVPMNGIGR